MAAQPSTASDLAALVPLMIIQIPFAFAALGIAKRVGGRNAVWFIVSIIPLVGFIFIYYVAYRVAASVLDSLAELKTKVAPPSTLPPA
jgi:hypothetical protein